MKLLPPDALVRTGPVDHADWNFRPVLGAVSRQRFHLVVSLLPREPRSALLEIGYGSGIFMPELASHTTRLAGVDIHAQTGPVTAALAAAGVRAELVRTDGIRLPFPDGTFNTIVAVSALEFIEDLPAACREMRRVLAPGGRLIAVMPGNSPLLDLALRLTTGESAKSDYGDRRTAVLPTLTEYFRVEKSAIFPPLLGQAVPIYTALRFRPRHRIRTSVRIKRGPSKKWA